MRQKDGITSESKVKNLWVVDQFSGQSLFEVVLALGVMTIITVGVIILTSYSVRNAAFARNKNLASKHSQEAIEWLRGRRDTDIQFFITSAQTNSYCLDNLNFSNTGTCASNEFIPNTGLLRDLTFTRTTVSGKNIITATVVVSWTDARGRHEARSVTDFLDTREQ